MTVEKYLQAYSKLETILKDVLGIAIKEYEDTLTDLNKQKLYICRVMRNYLAHNEDKKFIEISDNQGKFLEDLYKEVKEKKDLVKQHMQGRRSIVYAKEDDKMITICEKMANKGIDYCVIIDDKWTLKGIIDMQVLLKLGIIRKDLAVKKIMKNCEERLQELIKKEYVKFYEEDDLWENVQKEEYRLIVVIENKAKNIVKGIIYKD